MKNIRFYTIAVLFGKLPTPKVNPCLHMDFRYSTFDIGSHVISCDKWLLNWIVFENRSLASYFKNRNYNWKIKLFIDFHELKKDIQTESKIKNIIWCILSPSCCFELRTNDEIIVIGWLGNNWELVLNLSADVLLVFYLYSWNPVTKTFF